MNTKIDNGHWKMNSPSKILNAKVSKYVVVVASNVACQQGGRAWRNSQRVRKNERAERQSTRGCKFHGKGSH